MFDTKNADDAFRRLPGLYRWWELARLLRVGADYRLEDAGTTCDGTPLLAVFTMANLPETDGRAGDGD